MTNNPYNPLRTLKDCPSELVSANSSKNKKGLVPDHGSKRQGCRPLEKQHAIAQLQEHAPAEVKLKAHAPTLLQHNQQQAPTLLQHNQQQAPGELRGVEQRASARSQHNKQLAGIQKQAHAQLQHKQQHGSGHAATATEQQHDHEQEQHDHEQQQQQEQTATVIRGSEQQQFINSGTVDDSTHQPISQAQPISNGSGLADVDNSDSSSDVTPSTKKVATNRRLSKREKKKRAKRKRKVNRKLQQAHANQASDCQVYKCQVSYSYLVVNHALSSIFCNSHCTCIVFNKLGAHCAEMSSMKFTTGGMFLNLSFAARLQFSG